jgi:nitroreductase
LTDLRELRRLEPIFYRAPSAHNTQPWLLEYAADRIEVRFDPARYLEAGDPTRRDLFLSLGAFVEAVLITAAADGVGLAFEPAVEGTRVGSFAPDVTSYATRFSSADLERRQTSRLQYEPGRLDEGVLAAARDELGDGARLHELGSRDVVDLFTVAARHMYEMPPVVAELRSWLRLSKRDPDYERDGLSYECLDLSRIEAGVLSLLLRPWVYRAVRSVHLHHALAASERSVLDSDVSILVLEGSAEGPANLIAHGRTLLRVWLALSSFGVYAHPLSQIIDCATTETAIAERLELSPDRHLLSIFRAGTSKQPARSHRLR